MSSHSPLNATCVETVRPVPPKRGFRCFRWMYRQFFEETRKGSRLHSCLPRPSRQDAYFTLRQSFKNSTSSVSEPNLPKISRGRIGPLRRRHEALSGMVPSAPTKTKGWQKKTSHPLKVAKRQAIERSNESGKGFHSLSMWRRVPARVSGAPFLSTRHPGGILFRSPSTQLCISLFRPASA